MSFASNGCPEYRKSFIALPPVELDPARHRMSGRGIGLRQMDRRHGRPVRSYTIALNRVMPRASTCSSKSKRTVCCSLAMSVMVRM